MQKEKKIGLFSIIIFLFFIPMYGYNMSNVRVDETSFVMRRPDEEVGAITLKVLTEKSMWSDRNGAVAKGNINKVTAYYKSEHPNVEFEIETCPLPGEQREYYLESRRVALMAGDTPDIYLMPTLSFDEIMMSLGQEKEYEPLFRDVAQAQTNHWFADISGYYNHDIDLKTEELQKAVMDAGVVNDARYILPMGYSFDMLLVDQGQLSRGDIEFDSCNLFDTLLNNRDPRWMPELRWETMPLNYLPQLCDYDKETNLVDKEELISLLKQINQIYTLRADYMSGKTETMFRGWSEYTVSTSAKLSPFSENTYAVYCPLERVLAYLPTMKCTDNTPVIYPIRAVNGDLIADVTYWGAISSACSNIDVAYDFLRLFLTPEVQHGGSLVDSAQKEYQVDFSTAFSPGWPVRYKNFIETRWKRIRSDIEDTTGLEDRMDKILAVQLSDVDLAILEEPIAYTRFPCVFDLEIYSRLEPLRQGVISDMEIEKIANEFVKNLTYHLAEG